MIGEPDIVFIVRFKFKAGVKKLRKEKVVSSLEDFLGCYSFGFKLWIVCGEYRGFGIDWGGTKARAKKIEPLVKKNRSVFQYFTCDLYYIDRPDELVDLGADGELLSDWMEVLQ
jgi:hypothetical protein